MRVWSSPLVRQNRQSSVKSTFASSIRSNEGEFVPIGDVVASDVCQGPALQQANKSLVQLLSAHCGQSEHWYSDCAQLLLPSFTCPPGVMFGSTDPVQVFLHVFCHCEDNELFLFLSPFSACFGVSQYRHCYLLPWPHVQSSCLVAACLRHVLADSFGVWSQLRGVFSVS